MCARGDGIRRSKDLRAEIGKFPNSTNERKKMSTKTNFKRIALVAALSLGAGVISVAPASATTLGSIQSSTGVVSPIVTADTSATFTGTITSAGSVTFASVGTAVGAVTFAITGGTFSGMGGAATAFTPALVSGPLGTVMSSAVAVPKAAGTNMVVVIKDGATTVTTATITVVAAGLSGVYSASNSQFSFNATETGDATAADAIGYAVAANAGNLILNYDLYDGLGTLMPSTTTVYAQVNEGCLIGTTATPTVGGATGTDVQDGFFISQATTEVSVTCTVAIYVDGVKVTSRVGVIQGAVASLATSSIKLGSSANLAAQTGLGYVVALDAKGNSLGNISVVVDPVTLNDNSSVTAVAVASNLTSSVAGTQAAPGAVPATVGWTCSGITGKASVRLKFSATGQTTVYSPVFDATCYGNPATYAASFDKASYVPGDIATLTVTAKDSKGNPVNDASVLGTAGATATAVAITGSQMTPVATPLDADLFSEGKKSYKFIVGSTEGSYAAVVALPKWNSTTYSQTSLAVSYKVAASTTTVTNADVLKSIVALIASINKQIQALQKLILKR